MCVNNADRTIGFVYPHQIVNPMLCQDVKYINRQPIQTNGDRMFVHVLRDRITAHGGVSLKRTDKIAMGKHTVYLALRIYNQSQTAAPSTHTVQDRPAV